MQAIGAMLERTAREHPENVAIVFEDAIMTYTELNKSVNRLTDGLINLGVQKGDRIMVQLVNGPEIIMAHYAIIRAGAIAVPLNVMYVAHEIQYIGEDTAANVVVLDSRFLHLFDEVRLIHRCRSDRNRSVRSCKSAEPYDPAPGHLFCGNAHHVCLFAAGLRCHPA